MSGQEQLAGAFLSLHSAHAARLLEAMPVEQANAVIATVDPPTAAPVFAHMLPTYAAQCIELQLPADGALLLERLGTQEAAAILRHLGRHGRRVGWAQFPWRIRRNRWPRGFARIRAVDWWQPWRSGWHHECRGWRPRWRCVAACGLR